MLAIRADLRKYLRSRVLPVVLIVLACGSRAQEPSSRLADYVGTYAGAPGHTLEIVDGDGLFAVVDEAKYPLRTSGVDQFTTITGQWSRSPAMQTAK